MKYKILAYLTMLAVIAGIFVLLFGCSPQKRLDRLVSNNPELADTTFSTRPVSVPGFTIEKHFTITNDTAGLAAAIRRAMPQATDEQLRPVITEIHKYYAAKPCIDKPVSVSIPGGGIANISPVPGGIVVSINQPPQIIPVKVPVLVVHAENRIVWPPAVATFVIGILATLGAQNILKRGERGV